MCSVTVARAARLRDKSRSSPSATSIPALETAPRPPRETGSARTSPRRPPVSRSSTDRRRRQKPSDGGWRDPQRCPGGVVSRLPNWKAQPAAKQGHQRALPGPLEAAPPGHDGGRQRQEPRGGDEGGWSPGEVAVGELQRVLERDRRRHAAPEARSVSCRKRDPRPAQACSLPPTACFSSSRPPTTSPPPLTSQTVTLPMTTTSSSAMPRNRTFNGLG